MKIFVCIPTYNEAENISSTINAVLSEFEKIKNHEMNILVADDTSPDKTYEIVEKIAKSNPRVHLLLNPNKIGIGGAYIKAMKYAMNDLKADAVIELDADGQHKPSDIPRMVDLMDKENAEVVVGTRYIKGGKIPEEWGLKRKFFSVFGNMFARSVLWMWKYHDITTGFRLTKTSALKKVDLDNLISKQFAYKLHLYYALHKSGVKIVELPIEFVEREKGKSKITKKTLQESMRVVLTLRYRENEKFFKVCVIGLIGFVIQSTGFNILRLTGMEPWWANTIAVEFAIISNYLLNNFWTFSAQRIGLKELITLKIASLSIKINAFFYKFILMNAVSLGSILIQAVLIYLGVRAFGKGFWIENGLMIAGILIGLIWNFTMYKKVIWKK